MIVRDPIPGQEERNCDFVLEAGAGVRTYGPASLRYKLGALLADPRAAPADEGRGPGRGAAAGRAGDPRPAARDGLRRRLRGVKTGVKDLAERPLPLVFPFPGRSVTVDQVALEERAASLGKRSIKKATKVAGIRLAISMCDLTTLEGKDSPGKVRQMCAKAMRPGSERPLRAAGRGRLRLPGPRRDREAGALGLDREGRERRDGVPVRDARRSPSSSWT